MKPQSRASAKHKFPRLVMNLVNQKFFEFCKNSRDLRKGIQNCCPSDHSAIQKCQDASTHEDIQKPGPLTFWKQQTKFNSTLRRNVPQNQTPKDQNHNRNPFRLTEERRPNWMYQCTKKSAENIKSGHTNSNPKTKLQMKAKTTKHTTEMLENPKLSTHRVRPVTKNEDLYRKMLLCCQRSKQTASPEKIPTWKSRSQ